MTGAKLTIGSRGSDLALYQANFIREILEQQHDCSVKISIINTAGDADKELPFEMMEGTGYFTKELEEALLQGEIDVAVHSLKDVMTTQPQGLMLGAVGYRIDRREILLIRKGSEITHGLLPVKSGGIIGTSSLRRKCQIAFHNPTLIVKDLRGNVPTRIAKLRNGYYDAILIAAAGVKRLELDLSEFITLLLDSQVFLPAPAQGMLGIQIRSKDSSVKRIISRLGSDTASLESTLERGLLKLFNAGCSLPLGVYSETNGGNHRLKAVLGIRDGGHWAELKQIDVNGSDAHHLVNQAYAGLNKEVQNCA